MRKVTLFGLLLGALVVACESKTPVGPSTVTVQVTTTTTVPVTTTVPGTSTTVPPVTTSVAPTSMTRRYLGSSGNPVLPNDMTLALSLVTGAQFEALDGLPLNGTQATYSVTGFYRTGNGGGGNVRGTLDGTLDNGNFNGTMSADVPGYAASREFRGQLTATALTWSGGLLNVDCKDNPLSFSNLTMVTAGTLPPTTTIPTTTTPSCNYGLNPGGASIGLSGGSGSIQVITQPGCGWSAQSVVNWVTLQPASGSSGPGSVQYVATEGGPRETTLIIAGLPFVLRQEAVTTPTTTTTTAACTYALSPTNATVPPAGGAGSVTVISQPGCAWNVQNFAPWITTTPASGTGSGQVSYTAAATMAARDSTIVIAGLPFLLRQDAPIVPPDLVPYSPLTGSEPFCRIEGSNFLVGVRNAGAGPAAGSVTRVTFTPSEGTPSSSSLPTIALPAGGNVDVVFAYPSNCYYGCDIQIVVDANNDLAEGVAGEGNNTVTASCGFIVEGVTRRRPQ